MFNKDIYEIDFIIEQFWIKFSFFFFFAFFIK